MVLQFTTKGNGDVQMKTRKISVLADALNRAFGSATLMAAAFQPPVVSFFSPGTEFFFPAPERYFSKKMNRAKKESNKRYSKPFVSNMFT